MILGRFIHKAQCIYIYQASQDRSKRSCVVFLLSSRIVLSRGKLKCLSKCVALCYNTNEIGKRGVLSRAVSPESHQKPRFFYATRNSQSTDPIHHKLVQYNILRKKEQKMSQSFNNNYRSNNYNSFNTTCINTTVAHDRSDILAWLSPLDPKLRHQGLRERRVESIGEWVLQTEEFKSWYAGAGSGRAESDKPVLFCYGGPGVGKTYIR